MKNNHKISNTFFELFSFLTRFFKGSKPKAKNIEKEEKENRSFLPSSSDSSSESELIGISPLSNRSRALVKTD